MENNHNQQSNYLKPTKMYSNKVWKKLQTTNSTLKLQPFITFFSSNKWSIIQHCASPVYTYDQPPDSLMF